MEIVIGFRNGVANGFDGLKRFTENLEGIDKIAGVIQPLIALIHLEFGAVIPIGILNSVEDLKSIKAVKNACMWIGSGDDAFKRPWTLKLPAGLKDYKAWSSFINTIKRTCFIVAAVLMIGEYWHRIHRVAMPPLLFTLKIAFLLAGVALSAIKGLLDLREHNINLAELRHERQFYIPNNPALTPEQIAKKMNELTGDVKALQTSLDKNYAQKADSPHIVDIYDTRQKIRELEKKVKKQNPPTMKTQAALADEKKLLLRLKTQKLMEKVNNVAVDEFAELDKQKLMLKILENGKKPVTQEKLNDVKTLLKMNKKQFVEHQIKVLNVREENLVMERKRTYRGIAFDISKVFVFTLVLTKAPILSLVPINFTHVCKQGMEGVALVSGLLGVRKFAFDSYNKAPKAEPRPIIAA